MDLLIGDAKTTCLVSSVVAIVMLQGKLFDVPPANFRVMDLFVVKYSADSGQRSLNIHCDQSSHSFVISLSSTESGDFAGWYFSLDLVLISLITDCNVSRFVFKRVL